MSEPCEVESLGDHEPCENPGTVSYSPPGYEPDEVLLCTDCAIGIAKQDSDI